MITFVAIVSMALGVNLPTFNQTPPELPIDPKDWELVHQKVNDTVKAGLDEYGKGPNREPIEKWTSADFECLTAQIWKGYAHIVLYTALAGKAKLPAEWIGRYQQFYGRMDQLVKDKCGGGRGSGGQKLWSRWTAELRDRTGDRNAMPAPQNLAVKAQPEGFRIISDIPVMIVAGRLATMSPEFFRQNNNAPKVPVHLGPNMRGGLPPETVFFWIMVQNPRAWPAH